MGVERSVRESREDTSERAAVRAVYTGTDKEGSGHREGVNEDLGACLPVQWRFANFVLM